MDLSDTFFSPRKRLQVDRLCTWRPSTEDQAISLALLRLVCNSGVFGLSTGPYQVAWSRLNKRRCLMVGWLMRWHVASCRGARGSHGFHELSMKSLHAFAAAASSSWFAGSDHHYWWPCSSPELKKSVRSDRVICLDCGKHFSVIKRHLMTNHQLTPEQYRRRWQLSPTYPFGCACLREDPIFPGEEVRIRS